MTNDASVFSMSNTCRWFRYKDRGWTAGSTSGSPYRHNCSPMDNDDPSRRRTCCKYGNDVSWLALLHHIYRNVSSRNFQVQKLSFAYIEVIVSRLMKDLRICCHPPCHHRGSSRQICGSVYFFTLFSYFLSFWHLLADQVLVSSPKSDCRQYWRQ